MTEPLFTEAADISALEALRGDPDIDLRWPKLLAEMVDVAAAALVRDGLNDETAARAARTVMLALGRYFGGATFYLPKGDGLVLALRDDEIFRQFGVRPPEEIARSFGLTMQQVYAINRRQLTLRRRKLQQDLFAQTASNGPQSAQDEKRGPCLR